MQFPRSQNLTSVELDAHVANGTFRLALVGMSNAGKSYRSKVLRDEMGFLWYHVDEEICKAVGFTSPEDLSPWLGYPTSPQYPTNEKKYLELENAFTRQASMQTNGKNLVFDTTGSVVHLEPETIAALQEDCLIVHLDVGEDSLQKMLDKFFKAPKPVCWSGNFSMHENESEDAALRRCYPALLQKRLALYRTIAHLNIPAKKMRDMSGIETLHIIKESLA